MRIHIWIEVSDVINMNKFLSDDFGYDEEMTFKIWYSLPELLIGKIQISITSDQFAKLENF